ncbi:MAG: adenylate/guanylate cyclase domain-containing protein [Rhodospirillales bacterium]
MEQRPNGGAGIPAGLLSRLLFRLGRWAPIWSSLAVLLAMAALSIQEPTFVTGIRDSLFDAYQRLRPRPQQDAPVRIIDIDEESLARIGQWPWPRSRLAALVHNLQEMQATAVVLDILLAEPDRNAPGGPSSSLPGILPGMPAADIGPRLQLDPDAELARAIAAGKVVTGFALVKVASTAMPAVKARVSWQEGPQPILPAGLGAVATLPMLEQGAAGNGSLSISLATGGVIRQLPLLVRLGDRVYPSLAAEALRVAQGAEDYAVRVAADGAIIDVRIGAFRIPTDAAGQLWLYSSKPEDATRYLPAWRVLDGSAPREAIAGRVVLIGSTARGLQDVHQTPLGDDVPGVEFHAQALEQVIHEEYLRRPAWIRAAELGLLLGLGTMVLVIGGQLGPSASAVLAGLGVIAAFAASWGLFAGEGLLLDPLFAAAAVIAVYFTLSLLRHVQTEYQQRWIRKAFASYISPKLVNELVENPAQLKLGGERREISVVITDLEGFTPLVERNPPAVVVPALNDYLDGMIRIAFDYDGTVDKIVGDAVHVMFGAPVADPRLGERALACALAFDAFACAFADEQRRSGLAFGNTRIGVNAGQAIVGNFGGELRFDYTAHGDVINTASRLEGANKLLGTRICVSEAVVERCPGFVGRPAATLLLKGKTQPVRVFEPLPEEAAGSPKLRAWLEAFRLLEDRNPAAEAAFAVIAAANPDDPLARLHLRRLRAGETGTLLTLTEK